MMELGIRTHDGISGMLNVLIYPVGLIKLNFKHRLEDGRPDR